MAVLTVQSAVLSGLAESFASAAGGGDSFIDNGKQETFLEVDNAGGGSVTVTIPAQDDSQIVSGIGPVTIPDVEVAVGAGARKMIGPFPKAYRNAQNSVAVSYSGVSSVTVRAVRVSKIDG